MSKIKDTKIDYINEIIEIAPEYNEKIRTLHGKKVAEVKKILRKIKKEKKEKLSNGDI